MTTVPVALGERSYAIEIEPQSLSRLGDFLAARQSLSHVVVITDEQVESLYAETILKSLLALKLRVDLIAVPVGETAKCADCLVALWEKLLEFNTDRKSVVVALGGGVVGDLAGLVAATYARGLAFYQIPTTLLAQVDSSVGGKTGINLSTAKNMVGAFWQPRGVLIDPVVLQTQSERDYRSGLAEVVKYGVILDAAFLTRLETDARRLLDRDESTLAAVVARCCELKAQVVVADEREETGLRAILNYGHTFAHALESVAGYGELLHGEAVAIGMDCAARLAQKLGRIDAAWVARQQRMLQSLGLPTKTPALDPEELLDAMRHDKKVEHGKLKFILPGDWGRVEAVGGIDPQLVLSVWHESIKA